MRAILIDVGGVLLPDYLQDASAEWGRRLGIGPEAFRAALFGGNDDQVLIGRISETGWWGVVAGRLGARAGLIGEIRRDLAARHVWDSALVDCLRGLRGRAAVAIVSNAWPDMRARLAESGVLDLADAVVLSCEIGCAKPDHRIYEVALRRLGAEAADALFIDDTAGHVDAARALGMSGHLHTSTGETIDRIGVFGRVATAHCCAAAPSEPDVHDFHASGSSKPYGVLACRFLTCRLPVARRWQWVWSRRSRGSWRLSSCRRLMAL